MEQYYSRAHSMGDLSALCLSGGGIRSAAFALGIVQGLAKRGLLKQFDYLSTVSGGGYLGSFLTAWIQRRGYDAVCDDLVGKFKVTAGSPLKYLRRYTSYLTPSRGLFTADSLTIAALYLRNLFLNWLIVIPLVLTIIIAVKCYAVAVWTLPASITTATAFLMLAVSAGGMATLESLRQRPGWETYPGSSSQFQYWVKWTLFAGSMLLSVASANYLEFLNQLPSETYDRPIYEPQSFLGDFQIGAGEPTPAHEALRPPIPDGLHVFAFPAAMFAVINFVAWMIAFFMSASPRRDEISTRSTVRTSGWNALFNLISFTFAGGVAGGLIGVAFYLAAHLFWWFDFAVLIVICAGPLAVAGAVFVGEALHLGLTSYLDWSDGEREWLATAVGYHTRTAVSWFLLTFCVFGGSYLVFTFYREFGFGKQLASLGTTGGIAGVIVAWLSKASATAATIRERYDTWTNWSAGIVLAIAMPLFVFIAVAFLSAGVNAVLIGRTLTYSTTAQISRHSALFDGIFPLEPGELNTILITKLAVIFFACLLLWVVASRVIATNQFSLHGLYCNRLIRAFLGGSRNPKDRRPNALSQFDEHDNFDLSELWPNKGTGKYPAAAACHQLRSECPEVGESSLAGTQGAFVDVHPASGWRICVERLEWMLPSRERIRGRT
ncbi:patatin-like phospholipase family protein [Bradyrhizobium erythrophlei]|uniref:patatin-like phospholipase family protein n=1 Tax=Bradyrhizobium erythrophlei TaxID=1437360 RepID=UPI00155FF09D|nr:patatin-like phospholipase family protein [Bradyrhizobium erythrophlei]